MKRRWICGAAAGMVAVSVALIWSVLGRMEFDSRMLDLLPQSVPEVRALQEMERNFGDRNLLAITLKGEDPEALKKVANTIEGRFRGRSDLTGRAFAGPPMGSGAEAGLGEMAELAAFLWLNRDPADVRALAAGLEPGALEEGIDRVLDELGRSLDPAGSAAAHDPLGFAAPLFEERKQFDAVFGGRDGFESDDGRFRVVYVHAAGDLSGYREMAGWMGEVGSLLDEVGIPDGVAVRLAGAPAIRSEGGRGLVWDLVTSVLAAMLLGALAFWLMERRPLPMVLLSVTLVFALSVTLAIGWVAFGGLSAVGVGFAGILVGLAADYGIVLYYGVFGMGGATGHPVVRGVVGGAVTTGCVFGALALSEIPGAAQLGGLVGAGVMISAAVMLFIYRPMLATADSAESDGWENGLGDPSGPGGVRLWPTAVVVIGVAVALSLFGFPGFDGDAKSIGPRADEAADAGEEMAEKLFGGEGGGVDFLVAGDREKVSAGLSGLWEVLERRQRDGEVSAFWIPGAFVADRETVMANLETLGDVAEGRERIVGLLGEEFEKGVAGDADAVIRHWGRWAEGGDSGEVPWPESAGALGVLRGCVRRTEDGWAAKGRAAGVDNVAGLRGMGDARDLGVMVPDWEAVVPAVLPAVRRDLFALGVPVGVLFLVLLGIVFRNVRDVALSVAAVGLAGLLFLSLLGAFGIEWTLVNLAAVPLLIGISLDYSIHLILAMQEAEKRGEPGVLRATRGIGRALLLCAVSTGAGFGSIVLAGNRGLAGLGLVCALGIGCGYAVSAWLLPAWRGRLNRN